MIALGRPYLTSGVANGDYRIGFSDIGSAYHCNPKPYFTQFYDGKSTFASADTIAVIAPNIVGNINAALAQPNQETYLPMITK